MRVRVQNQWSKTFLFKTIRTKIQNIHLTYFCFMNVYTMFTDSFLFSQGWRLQLTINTKYVWRLQNLLYMGYRRHWFDTNVHKTRRMKYIFEKNGGGLVYKGKPSSFYRELLWVYLHSQEWIDRRCELSKYNELFINCSKI